ncbi:MAG: hypothetical protein ACRCXZ_01120 [Patescibacteria group bacterium]
MDSILITLVVFWFLLLVFLWYNTKITQDPKNHTINSWNNLRGGEEINNQTTDSDESMPKVKTNQSILKRSKITQEYVNQSNVLTSTNSNSSLHSSGYSSSSSTSSVSNSSGFFDLDFSYGSDSGCSDDAGSDFDCDD